MATWYTQKIADGITFKEFALNCARAFGALVTMRDDAEDAEIPDEFTPSDYHVKELEKAQNELAIIRNMTPDACEREAKSDYEAAVKRHKESCEKNRVLRNKYADMLKSVLIWEPPTKDHEEMKKFMAEQISESIKWDCSNSDAPTPKTGREWKWERINNIKHDISYHTKENEAEIKRCKDRTAWVQALKKSLA